MQYRKKQEFTLINHFPLFSSHNQILYNEYTRSAQQSSDLASERSGVTITVTTTNSMLINQKTDLNKILNGKMYQGANRCCLWIDLPRPTEPRKKYSF